jgi:hypothetical protein
MEDTDKGVDMVFKTGDNHPIVMEARPSKTSKSLLRSYLKDAFEQLKSYKKLIEEHGLDFKRGS